MSTVDHAIGSRQISILVAVADAGSVPKAAKQLGTTPAGVSKVVRSAEAQLGGAVFDRSSDGMVPTLAGHRLLAAGREILRHMEAAQDTFRHDLRGPSGRLRIGAGPFAAGSLAALLIPEARRRWPDLQLGMTMGSADVLLCDLGRGLIAPLPSDTIMADAGHISWDLESYKWLLQKRDFTSINPSLLRMARLNMNAGLYEVLPGKIYQVRGLDLTNITFVKGKTGWIIFDPLTSLEVARFALKFINDKLGSRPVVAVVYSHSHIDHFGGVRGVANEADVRSGKTLMSTAVGFQASVAV